MAIVDGSLQLGYKDSAWFTANASTVLLAGQIVYLEQTGTYKIGDGVTQLSALTFLGGGGTVDVNTIGSAINGATSATPNDTDLVMSVDTSVAKKNTWTQIKAFLKTYFDTVYANITDLTGYVKKGTLTTNYIPKATASDTIGDGQIYDDGVNGIQLNRYIKNAANTNNQVDLYYNTGSALLSDTQTEMLAPICQMSSASDHYARLESTGRKVLLRGDLLSFYQSSNAVGVVFDIDHGTGGGINDTMAYFYSSSGNTYLGIGKTVPTEALDVVGNVVISGLTASQIVETDSNKKLISASKGTAYNKDFGTTAGTVLEGDKGVLKSGDSMSGAFNESKSTDIASATTTDLSTSTGNLIHITGTTTITSFGTLQAGSERTLVFDGALTLTHNATSLILPGAANITTGAGDTAIFRSEGSGNWRCISYTTASDSYTNYTPTFTGFSAAPTVNTGDARWKMISRNTCHVIIYPSAVGTSNLNSLTVTLPFVSANIGSFGQAFSVPTYNNSAASLGSLRTRVNSNIADVYNGALGATFTAAGTKSVFVSIVYQIEL